MRAARFTCPHCGQGFSSPDSLANHIRLTHMRWRTK